MQLKDYIITYRSTHGLSQRQFADQCGLSNGYISMLEKGINPKTQQPITPTLPKLKLIASGMGITLGTLLSEVDDMQVDISSNDEEKAVLPKENSLTAEFAELFERLSKSEQRLIVSQIKGILSDK